MVLLCVTFQHCCHRLFFFLIFFFFLSSLSHMADSWLIPPTIQGRFTEVVTLL